MKFRSLLLAGLVTAGLSSIASAKFWHGNHPVLRWNASCCTLTERNDLAMFTKPEREKSSSRIDGMAAAADAMARALMHSGEESLPLCLTRGVL